MTGRSGRILGALLAGGRSSRFGSDKAMAILRGRTLLDRALEQLGAQADALVLCGREELNPVWLADRPRPGMGPLGGLNAALHYAAGSGFSGVLTSGCDMPLFPNALAVALIGEGPAILASMPLVGYWPASLADNLDQFLAVSDRHAVWAWAEHVGARQIEAPGLLLPNINRPEDLAALEASWEDVR